MIETTKSLDLFTKQHHVINELTIQILHLLEAWSVNRDSKPLADLRTLLIRLVAVSDAHRKQEEEALLPLLNEIYTTRDDMSSFVKEEHSHLQSQLVSLLETSNQIDILNPNAFHEQVTKVLNDTLEHQFIEEQALFPLVQRHLEQRDLKKANP